jgi:putative ABC transport system ATP-binding protein
MTRDVIVASGLSYGYPGPDGPVPVLVGVDLRVRSGEFVAVVGPSGGGKSTLMSLLGGLERPDAGTLEVAGQDLTRLAGRALERFRQQSVSFVFQFFNLLPTLTAEENVLLGMEAMASPPRDAGSRAVLWLDRVGLSAKRDRFPAQLSGGEQQRVAIARALARDAPLVLADEPTGNLDEDTAAAVMAVLEQARAASSATLVLITHDPAIASRADRVLELSRGRVSEVSSVPRPHLPAGAERRPAGDRPAGDGPAGPPDGAAAPWHRHARSEA